MRVVLDSNVLLAAYGRGGVCREVLEACLLVHQIRLSEFILSEFRRKLLEKFRMPDADVEANTGLLRDRCMIVIPEKVDPQACRDPNDLPVLGTLAAAGGDCLVTGDKDLLELGEFSGHPILSPREFLDRQSQSSPPSAPPDRSR
ncbi:MAG: putative toxin-antitoxin system toxin component, PIN family [Phycisphaerae bacterium]|nr:putative toxin-antitoxin system toxin component, PIN family [Phycisphaerae bacterium]